ncbi:MAG TPA: MotA/TolQ/ExbB proton channel family protein [Thermoguttaceae bacterium]|nr:MotA/TolQ/ExbB proton channel family protein [Thermoguttaceae bacterium]
MRHSRYSAVVWGAIWIAVLGLIALSAATIAGSSPVLAQEPAAEPAADEELTLEPPAKEEANAPADEDADENAPMKDKTYLEWLFHSLGISYSVTFFALSFMLVALVIMNLLAARREAVLPTALVEEFEALLNEQKYQEAYQRAKSDESMLGQVLSAGLGKVSRGYNEAIEAMQEMGEDENMKLEHRLSYIGLIGTVSPMVGLLGTVDGMIASFQVIATSVTAPKPSELAEGVATALFTTLVGLLLAIPAVAVYGILRNRFARLVLEVGMVSEDLMSRFSTVGEKKPK